MPLLSADVRLQLADRFKALAGPVQLALFAGSDPESEEVNQVYRDLVTEVASVAPQLSVAEYTDTSPEARTYGIQRFPTLVPLGEGGLGRSVHFAGLPGGYEFSTLIEDIVDISSGRSGLSETTRAQVQAIDRDLHIMVFVTPT